MQRSLTIGLEYSDYLAVDMTLFDVLCIDVADVCGVQIILSHRYVVKLVLRWLIESFFTDLTVARSGFQRPEWHLARRLMSDIPSSVKLIVFYIPVYYARQPWTCFCCGLLGHQAVGCSAGVVDQMSLFRENLIPHPPGCSGCLRGRECRCV